MVKRTPKNTITYVQVVVTIYYEYSKRNSLSNFEVTEPLSSLNFCLTMHNSCLLVSQCVYVPVYNSGFTDSINKASEMVDFDDVAITCTLSIVKLQLNASTSYGSRIAFVLFNAS